MFSFFYVPPNIIAYAESDENSDNHIEAVEIDPEGIPLLPKLHTDIG